jgi:hypothetical protein
MGFGASRETTVDSLITQRFESYPRYQENDPQDIVLGVVYIVHVAKFMPREPELLARHPRP